jgi:hypothetical protein
MRHQLARQAGHFQALARALRMPHHATLARAARRRRLQHLRNHRPHRVELVVRRNLLRQSSVILEDDKVAQVIEQMLFLEYAPHQRLQLAELPQRVFLDAVDRSPRHEPFLVCRERAHTRMHAV